MRNRPISSTPPNNSMQKTALRAAADAERWADHQNPRSPFAPLDPMAHLPLASAASALLFGACVARSASAQRVTEWSIESRTTLSFRVNEGAVQRLLPPGWTAAPSTAATNRGGNLTVVLIERQLVLDGQGKLLRTGTSRYVVLAVPARNAANEVNTVIVGGLSPEGSGAYGAYLTAGIARVERSAAAQGEDAGQATEHWEFAAASGEHLELRLSFRRAAPVRSHVETTMRSGTHPEVTRTYRIDQAVDLLRSAATDDRIVALTFSATGPSFASLFDGAEQLLSVTSLPWYAREVAVP